MTVGPATSARRVRVALVGAGWVSTNRHLPSLVRHPDVDVVGAVVPAGELPADRRTELATRHGLRHFGTSLDEAWLDDVDAVAIGTPPDTHHDLVTTALRRGLHVLVEKPFALTVADADDMVATAEETGRTLGVVHNLQFGLAASKIRRMLESGELGEVRAVFGVQSSNHQRRLPTWYKELPLGLFTDESPHLVYLLQSFLPGASLETLYVGRPLSAEDRTPDLVTLAVRSEAGVPGSLQMTFVGVVSEWILVVMGSKGTAVADFFRDVCFVLPDDGGHLGPDVLRTQVTAAVGHLGGTFLAGAARLRGRLDYGNDEVVRRFVDAVQTGSQPAGMSGAEGRDVVAVLEAAHRARAATEPGADAG